MWLSFFRLRCASQANLSKLWCKLQGWAFYNSKSSIPNGSASPFGRSGSHTSRPPSTLSSSSTLGPLKIPSPSSKTTPSSTLESLSTSRPLRRTRPSRPCDRRVSQTRRVPRDRLTTSRSSSPLRPPSALRPVNYLEIVEHLETVEWLRIAKHIETVVKRFGTETNFRSQSRTFLTDADSSSRPLPQHLAKMLPHLSRPHSLWPSFRRLRDRKTMLGRSTILSCRGMSHLEHSQSILTEAWCWCSFLQARPRTVPGLELQYESTKHKPAQPQYFSLRSKRYQDLR